MYTPYVLAIDFEAAGGIPSKHGFTELGAVLVRLPTKTDPDPKIEWTFNQYANMSNYEWDERCVKEFWSKHPDKFTRTKFECEKTTKDQYEVIEEFNQQLKDLVKKGIDFMIITDNSSFDVGIYKYFSKNQDILYITGKYQDIIDVTSFYDGFARIPLNVQASTNELLLAALGKIKCQITEPEYPVQHDHNPLNDATVIALRFAWLTQIMLEL